MADKDFSTFSILRKRFPANEYVLISEVSDKSGFGRSRSLDHMLINLWESRGLAITGIEVKSYRGDWLRELKNPKKQENHYKYCDYFYLLTDKPNVAYPDEIPITWGHWHIDEKGNFKVLKQASRLESVPVDRSLLCAMLRRAQSKEGYVLRTEITTAIDEAREHGKESAAYEYKRRLEEYESLQKSVKELEDIIGISLRDWKTKYLWRDTPKDIGKALRVLMDYNQENILNRVQEMTEQVGRIHTTLKTSLADIKKAFNDTTDTQREAES